jgi:dipeptidyl aminopeptidase/acylaminoacyl peptidase
MHWANRVLTLVFLLCATTLHAQRVSFADLARHAEYKNVKISPDGEYLAATAVIKGKTALALIHISDKKGMVVQPREGDDVIDFWWTSSKRVIYTVGTRFGSFDQPFASGELFGVNADGGNPRLLYGFRKQGTSTGTLFQHVESNNGSAEFVASIPTDPNHALVSISSWDAAGHEGGLPIAYKMDVRDGAITKIISAPGRDMAFVADHQGHIRFVYGEDVNGNARVFMHPLDGDGWQLMPKQSESRSFPWQFTSDDSLAYFKCSVASAGFGVCSWDPKTQAFQSVWTNAKVEPSGLLFGTGDDQVIGVTFQDGRAAAALFNGASPDAKTLVTLMKQFPGESVRIVSGTTDGRLSVVLVEADADPGTYYLFDRDSKKLTSLLTRSPWIHPEQMATKQPIELAARDGLKLEGYISYPPGHENAKHLPMVVFIHGGPYGIRDDWDYDPYVQMMATHGYAVLQVNYRGSGGRGYGFVKAGWGEWGGKMQDDVTDATHWAIDQGIADPRRICIFGGSYGGYAALEGAVKEPDLYKCAIGYVGVYDLSLMYASGDIPQSTSGNNYLIRVLGNDTTVLAAHSPINQLDHLKASVMLVVGGEDRRVPSIQGSNLHTALAKRGIAHVWLDKPDEMHGFYNEANLADLYTRVTQFLGSSIGPGIDLGTPAASGEPVASH